MKKITLFFALLSPLALPCVSADSEKADCCAAEKVTLKTAPKVMETVAPNYPLSLRKTGEQGVAEVEMLINERGEVVEARVVASTNPLFADQAVLAARLWRFEPAVASNGEKMAVRIQQPFTFVLPELAIFNP